MTAAPNHRYFLIFFIGFGLSLPVIAVGHMAPDYWTFICVQTSRLGLHIEFILIHLQSIITLSVYFLDDKQSRSNQCNITYFPENSSKLVVDELSFAPIYFSNSRDMFKGSKGVIGWPVNFVTWTAFLRREYHPSFVSYTIGELPLDLHTNQTIQFGVK